MRIMCVCVQVYTRIDIYMYISTPARVSMCVMWYSVDTKQLICDILCIL